MEAVEAVTRDCPVIGVSYEKGGSGVRQAKKRAQFSLQGPRLWSCSGASGSDCMTCAADATNGLMKQLGLKIGLAVVGVNREHGFQYPGDGDGVCTVDVARRAALLGVPTVAIVLPTEDTAGGSGSKKGMEVAQKATVKVLDALVRHALDASPPSIGSNRLKKMKPASNHPRMHFPFPGNGRWSALGSSQLPLDFSLESGQNSSDFALEDCWSLGGEIPFQRLEEAQGQGAPTSPSSSASSLVSSLQEAFAEGDVFVCIHVPDPESNSNSNSNGNAGDVEPPMPLQFNATKPAVLWEQNAVTLASASSEEGKVEEGDLFGRSLPLHNISNRSPTSKGARFVRQLQTETLVERKSSEEGEALEQEQCDEYVFDLTRGTILHDASSRGDVDAILRQQVAVSTMQTWPPGHPFSLLDKVLAESLREDEDHQGLPAWMCSQFKK